jgi:two-component system nitrogen regulation response regulator NtrX
VRELRHVIELARVLADCRQVIDAADVHEALCDLGGARGEPTSNGLTGEAERQRLVDALERCGGEAQKAAQSIGISRSHMYRRMRELGIAPRGRQSLT